MGEAKNKRLTHAQILANATGCVYCNKFSKFSIEHMPPRNMFQTFRPKGWEFACCNACNQGTKGADALAGMMAHMEAVSENGWKLNRFQELFHSANIRIPGLYNEIFGNYAEDSFVSHKGLLRPVKKIWANGPLMRTHLNVFSAKLAMATFCQFTKRPIDQNGLIYTEWYLNGGISEEIYNHTISIMPSYAQLVQGTKSSGSQFHLRYNTNTTDIVAAMVSFHNSFFVTLIATDNSLFAEPLREIYKKSPKQERQTLQITRPGIPKLLGNAFNGSSLNE